MKALVYHGYGKHAWEDKPKPELLDSTDAIVRIRKTTLCASDLPCRDDGEPEVLDGLTLGHEGVGIIEEVGRDVTLFKVGDRAAVWHAPSCGKCDYCRRGLRSVCDRGGWILGRLTDGTLAEYVRIPGADTNLQHVPDGVDEGTLMMLIDILQTGLEICVPDGQILPGATVAIFGSGHIGLTALLLAQFHMPAEIIMIDTHSHGFAAAKDLGATRLINAAGGNALSEIMHKSGSKPVDVAIVANAKVALDSIWRSYGQSSLPLERVLLMPSRRLSA